MRSKNYLTHVRDQYERYPFPVRDPQDERRRLIPSELDRLPKIDHYCFGGRRDFGQPMRILVAGGGTGDALVFLAEQLRGCPVEFVFVDMSAASLETARARAEVRGVDNVTWIHGSILDLCERDNGLFDYINCVGVLHHLEDPGAGLSALRSCLAEGGGMGVMLYGKYGRRHVYRVQELLRLVSGDGPDLAGRVEQARQTLTDLASRGHIQVAADAQRLIADPRNDAYLVDTYLHGVDRAYSVGDIYELLGGCGLQPAGFTNFFEEQGRACALDYDPTIFFTDPELLAQVSSLPPARQGHIADLLGASISMHAFYVTASGDSAARANELDLAPGFVTTYGQSVASAILEERPESVSVMLNCGVNRRLAIGAVTRELLARIDGRQRLMGICQVVASAAARRQTGQEAGPGTAPVAGDRDGKGQVAQVLSHVDLLVRLGLVTLRDPALPPLPILPSTRRWNGAIDLRPFTPDGAGQ